MSANESQAHYIACRDGNLERLKEIFADGSTQVDINDRYEDRRFTLLHVASWERHNDIACFLLESGFKDIINEKDRDGDTALHLSALKGDENTCRTLFNAGADVTILNEKGNSPFHQACKHPSSAICNMLLIPAAKCLDLANKQGLTPLIIAARHDSTEVCRLLLEEIADHMVRDENEDTALHISATRSCLDLCKTLVEADKEFLSETDKKGDTALHRAAERNHPKICRLFLENGCELNTRNKQGNTPLHIAADTTDFNNPTYSTEICKMLLEKGADWSLTNNYGDTPLHIAGRKVNVDIVNMLVKRKADVLVENKAGRVPWDAVPTSRRYKLDALKAATEKERFSKLEEESGSTPVKNVKLFLCGDPAVGKTTLRRSLTKGRIAALLPRASWRKHFRRHIPTPGVNVKPKNIRGVGNFVIWDMAGQIEYHVTHAMLLGASKGVFVVAFDMTWTVAKRKERLMYWLGFIKAGHDPQSEMKPSVVVVGTHIDKIGDIVTARGVAQSMLDDIIHLFKEFLNLQEKLILIDGRFCRTEGIRELKAILKTLAGPLREVLTPKICADIAKRMASWGKSKLPIMNFPEFLKRVNDKVNPLANESLVRLVVGYLHQTGELHCAKVRQPGNDEVQHVEPSHDLIILNPNWLTSTIFGPIFAKPEFRKDYRGWDEKQVYQISDLKHYFKLSDPKLLVDLLEYFELAYKRDESCFIIPVKLPPGVDEIDWTGHERYTNHYGLRIECRDVTDMFTVDTFPCLQVRGMKQYKQEYVDPILSHFGLKVSDTAEGMVQLTQDKRAIHIAVRVMDGNKEEGRKQLEDMKEMVEFELKERSIGTRVNMCYLSPKDLRKSTDLETDVGFYKEEEVENAKKRNKFLTNSKTLNIETLEDVTGMRKKDVLSAMEILDASSFQNEETELDHSIAVEDDEALQDLAKRIGKSEWESLGRYLGIKNSEIHGIKDTHKDNHREQIFQMLLKWRQRQPIDADREVLLKKALVKAERLDLAYGISASAKALNDTILTSVIKQLARKEWETLAICIGCTPEDIDVPDTQHFNVFIRWRRRQPRNIDVVKYMAAGLRLCDRKDLADQLEKCTARRSSECALNPDDMNDSAVLVDI